MNITLSLKDFSALSPLIIILGGALLLLILESFFDKAAKKFSGLITLLIFSTSILTAFIAQASDNPLITPWIKFDELSKLFTFLFLSTGFFCTLLSISFFQKFEASHGEYYFLLLSAVFGLILIGIAADFLMIFLGLETLSIALYILCGYMKKWEISHEASLKYVLMGSVAAAFLLYGIALIYGAVGTTHLNSLLQGYHSLTEGPQKTLFLAGVAFVTLGLAFKAAIVPFHVWAPDVYEGAPNPVTAFMAVGTKAGAFAAFIRIFLEALSQFNPIWNEAIAWLAYPTLIYANYVAMRENQLRRFFAYSGISHAGFMLIPLAANSSQSIPALTFYLVVYAIATMGCFAVLAYLDDRKEGVMMRDLHGLFGRSPVLASIFSLCLLTLGGIPPTAGFFAKFYLFKVAFDAGYYALVIVGLLTTILSAYYYSRMIAVMLSESPIKTLSLSRAWSSGLVSLSAAAAILAISCFPSPLMKLLDIFSQ